MIRKVHYSWAQGELGCKSFLSMMAGGPSYQALLSSFHCYLWCCRSRAVAVGKSVVGGWEVEMPDSLVSSCWLLECSKAGCRLSWLCNWVFLVVEIPFKSLCLFVPLAKKLVMEATLHLANSYSICPLEFISILN